MPITWETVDEHRSAEEMLDLMRELFPLPRSLTGDGVRETLTALSREVPLDVIETPTGTALFDWTVPREWTIRGGWIETPGGQRIVDFADSSLHVLGYSKPIDENMSLEELRPHIYTHSHDPDIVPYRTSYWEERWGFCMSRRQLDSLKDGLYRAVIDATFSEGSLTTGELTIRGASEKQFVLSSYVCHPALANDNLSGVVLLWSLAKRLAGEDLRYTYRLLWGPGTLGALCWLQRNIESLDLIEHGLAISCVGDPGPLRYKRSRREDAEIDRAAATVLDHSYGSVISNWEPAGGDERQFCSPGFDLPVGAFSRTPHGHFPEYHSSADNLDLVSAHALANSYRATLEIIDAIETNARFRNLAPYGEPQLGRRGLYPSIPDGTNIETALLWILNLSDGKHDIISIAKRARLPYKVVRDAATELQRAGLLVIEAGPDESRTKGRLGSSRTASRHARPSI